MTAHYPSEITNKIQTPNIEKQKMNTQGFEKFQTSKLIELNFQKLENPKLVLQISPKNKPLQISKSTRKHFVVEQKCSKHEGRKHFEVEQHKDDQLAHVQVKETNRFHLIKNPPKKVERGTEKKESIKDLIFPFQRKIEIPNHNKSCFKIDFTSQEYVKSINMREIKTGI